MTHVCQLINLKKKNSGLSVASKASNILCDVVSRQIQIINVYNNFKYKLKINDKNDITG